MERKKVKVKMSVILLHIHSLSRPKPDLTLAQSPKDRYGGKLSGSRACTWFSLPLSSPLLSSPTLHPVVAPSLHFPSFYGSRRVCIECAL